MNRVSHGFDDHLINPVGFTADEFIDMIGSGAFDDMKVELVNGEIVRLAPSKSRHGLVMAHLMLQLGRANADRSFTIFNDTILTLGEKTVRAFDIALARSDWRGGRELKPSDIRLGIEISDESLTKDLGEKRADYAAAGIPNYWVVDTNSHIVHVFGDPADSQYRFQDRVEFGERLALPDGAGSLTLEVAG